MEAVQRGETTLAELFVAYEKNRTPRKCRVEQESDRRRTELWVRLLGAEKVVHVLTFGELERYIDQRRSGAIDARGRPVEGGSAVPSGTERSRPTFGG